MNGDVVYDLQGGHVSFDTLWRLDQLTATLTGLDGWRVQVQIDPGIVLTATPARDLDPTGSLWAALHALEQAQNASTEDQDAPDPADGRTALEGAQ